MSPFGLRRAGAPLRRRAVVPIAVIAASTAAGCSHPATSAQEATPSPFADCAALTTAPRSAPSGSTLSGSAPSGSALSGSAPSGSALSGSVAAGPTDLPALRLPCFTGGAQVDLTAIRGPAVINFWASWCGPCRTELPAVQRLADRAQGRLHVLGVDTGDQREAGASFAADHKVTMPTLFDADRTLFNALAGRALPMTVFVDAAGHRSVYLLPLDERELAEQVRAHAGVTVTP